MARKIKDNHLVKRKTHVQENAGRSWQIASLAAAAFIIIVGVGTLLLKNSQPEAFVVQVIGAPSIKVLSEPVIDHGDLVVNNFVTSSFEVQNVGDETLHILGAWVQVHEGCCPPQAAVSNERLRPGETTTVSMRYTMHPGMDGPHDLRIHLATNDPNNPEIELTALSNWVGG